MRGKPLWFLALVVGSWTAGRVAMLWPEAALLPLPQLAAAPGAMRPAAPVTEAVSAILPEAHAASFVGSISDQRSSKGLLPVQRPTGSKPLDIALANKPDEGRELASGSSPPVVAIGLPSLSTRSAGSRWSGSGWVIVRDGGRIGALPNPLLGGSQAGARIVYALDDDRRLAVFGRAAAPLGKGPAEVALGAQWRPGRLPITAYGEGRLLGGRVSPAAGVFGGGETTIRGFRLEGYGEAGVIARDGVSGFGDGQLRLTRQVGGIDVGAGAWGAAQRGAARLDIGPSAAVRLPAKPLNLRLTLDWRQRIAGDARPASGPVLSLGADF